MENVIMEEKINFVFKPSLQYMALVKIVIEMWKQDDVLTLMPSTFDNAIGELNIAKYQVKINVRKLKLPDVMKNQLSALVWPIAIHMFRWYQHLHHQFNLERINPKQLCWTSYGAIDRKKSVLVLVKDQRLDVEQRYSLACTYCLTDEINELMTELRNEQPDNWINNLRGHLVKFWTYYLTGDIAKLNAIVAMHGETHAGSPGLFAFKSAVFSFNSVATKYLFENMLSPAEKETISFHPRQLFQRFAYNPRLNYDASISREFVFNFTCFLLSRMDRDEQVEIFEEHPAEMLKTVLVWPYQCFFLETAKRMWTFLSKDQFTSSLFEIFDKIDHGCKLCEYRDIFCQFWELSTSEYKKYVVDSINFKRKLFSILRNEEEDICRMILAEASAVEKEQLVRDDFLASFFYEKIIAHEKWSMLKFFLTECAPSEETIDGAKILMSNLRHLKAFKNQIKKFLQILDSYCGNDGNNTDNYVFVNYNWLFATKINMA